MPNSKRWDVKRKLDQVITHIESGQLILINLADLYQEHHPEIANNFNSVAVAFETLKPVVQKQRDDI